MKHLVLTRRTTEVEIWLKRVLRQALIPSLAFVAFLLASHIAQQFWFTSDSSVKKKKNGDIRCKDADVDDILCRTKSTYLPYRGHGPYVTDKITSFVINAPPCPESNPPIKKRSNLRKGPWQQLVVRDTIFESSPNEYGGPESHDTKNHTTLYDALFIVASNVRKSKSRDTFRQIYGNPQNTWPYRLKVVFLLGLPTNVALFLEIQQEARLYSDIVMGNFVDHYDNLTYKTVMGFRWVHTHCRNLDLMLKLDDDVFVDVYKFMEYFRPLVKRQIRTIYGYLNDKPKVHRDGKYMVYHDEFKDDQYPPFCSGFFIVPTMDIIDQYYALSKDIRFFRLEDVFSYGLLRSAMVDVQLIHLDVITVVSTDYIKCVTNYKYKCKYMASQISDNFMPVLIRTMAKYRKDLGLVGKETGTEEI